MENSTLQKIELRILSGALTGENAHAAPLDVLDGLKWTYTGKKILNTPYTIWQCLKHINYWQDKFIRRLNGEEVTVDASWKEGWEEKLNAVDQREIDREIARFRTGLEETQRILQQPPVHFDEPSGPYQDKYAVVQAMASHISYHIAEIVLLRRIFGAWPPKSGGMVW